MEKTIEDSILALSPNKQLLFGISCVIRMESFLESYLISTDKRSRFVPISQLTDKVLFNCTLELFNQIETRISCDDIKLVEQIIPDTDEDGRNEAVLAQNAAIALAYCLDFIKENDAKYIRYCAIKLIETADIITPVRDKDPLRKVPIAYSFQCALAVPRAYSRRNSMQPMPHKDS